MDYLIFNEEGEMIECLPFETNEELESYKKLNPKHSVVHPDDYEDGVYLLLDEEFEEEEDVSLPW